MLFKKRKSHLFRKFKKLIKMKNIKNKKIKPLTINLNTAYEQAMYYVNKHFNFVPLQLITDDPYYFENILYPGDEIIYEEYIQDLDEKYEQEKKILQMSKEDILNSDEFDTYKRESYPEPVWGTVFGVDEFFVNSIYMNVDKLYKLGLGVIDQPTGYYIFVSGAGYDFYEHHWIPLFKELDWIQELDDNRTNF